MKIEPVTKTNNGRTPVQAEALVRVMARRCGFEDPDEWAAKPWSERFPLDHADLVDAMAYMPERCTGRTTRMLLQALVALECGARVEIVGRGQRHAARLREALDTLTIAAGLDDYRKSSLRWRWKGYRCVSREPADVCFVDHTVSDEAKAEPAALEQPEPKPKPEPKPPLVIAPAE